jgi:cytochrome b6-f complex iron-sulfur subunit
MNAPAPARLQRPGRLSRRAILRGSFALGLGGLAVAAGGLVLDFLTPRGVTGHGDIVDLGAYNHPPGSRTHYKHLKLWLLHLTAEQGGPGYLALSDKCSHLGCRLPWRDDFEFVDNRSGTVSRGWFRCPCHDATFNEVGVRVYGPAPRSMDRYDLELGPGRSIIVNTGRIRPGTLDNAKHIVRAKR